MCRTIGGRKIDDNRKAIVAVLILIFSFILLGDYFLPRQALAKDSTYTILCLGETLTILGGECSTSELGGENSYPKQIEHILNASGRNIKFKVINRGALGIISSAIVTQLNENLKKYKPDMVIVMMGINDDNREGHYEEIGRAHV